MSKYQAALAAAISLCVGNAKAQEATELPIITVQGQNTGGSLTAPSIATLRENLYQTAGSVAFVDAEKYRNTFANNLRDMLKDVPGVFVQNRYSQELRVSIRGSGIARAYHTRGVEMLQDGIPTNFADGSGDFYQIDPLAARAIEVYKGGNALPFGTSTLGGAINAVTPTAYTATAPNILRVDGGSFGTGRFNAQMSHVLGDVDFLFNGTVTHVDGYRQHERQQSEQFNGNIGYRIAPNVETRFYFGAYIFNQKLPGTLTLDTALTNPRQASTSALTGDQARNTRTERIANRTTIAFDTGKLDLDTWGIHKNLYHPIFQVIDQDYWTWGVAPRYSANFDLGGYRNDLVVGARYFGGDNHAKQYINISGQRGALTVDARQRANNSEAFFENRFWVLPQVALMAGAKWFHDERHYANFTAATQASKSYDGINPKLGVLWQPLPSVQVFADITRSQDVPDFSDLAQTNLLNTIFVPLSAQKAWTAEIGSRGQLGRFAWDLTFYHSILRDEMLQYTTNPNIPAATFNAPRTIHQGVEFGGSVDVIRDVTGIGDRIALAEIWTVNDFRFDNDPQYRNNRLPGIPVHVLRTTVTYERPDGFYFRPTFDWVPQGAYVDYANTQRVPGYVLLGLETGIDMANGISIFLDARNLTNKHYIADFGPVTQAVTSGASATATFYPGAGRSLYAGMRWSF
jgi:iron complex outermembrane receptor protein